MNLQQIGFLFDLDGVIIDSERVYSDFWRGINEEYPTGIEKFELKIKGTTIYDILQRYFPDPSVSVRIMDRLIEFERNFVYEACDGAVGLLDNLCARGIPCALVTSSDEAKMNNLWRQMPELQSRFDIVVDGGMVTRSKPDPEGYIMAASKLGLNPQDCVVVEDARLGMQAGRSAGAFVVGITSTLGRDAVDGLADIYMDNVGQLDVDRIIALVAERRNRR